ncbi:liver carboxylesterase 1F [Octopus sinensis]|uniref:Liver carboxylesterase 1F n=1 Tax=Octopus sinensis TaxID=2607531 RepID=A0A6P7TN08_9MOLL|nr:liver carboxylesterase 1F [Octopus sinensis]
MAPNLITREQNVDDVSSENSAPEEPKKVPRPHHQLPTIVIVSQDTAYDQLLPRQSLYLDYPYHCTQQHYWRSKKATFLFSIVILVLLALFCITIIATTNIVKQVKQSNKNLALVVETSCGPVDGEYDGKNFVFRGIPYAVPPTGSQRWSQSIPNMSSGQCQLKGQAVDSTKSILCSQRNFQNGNIVGQEDCLYLNIWLPKRLLKETTNLPVIVIMQGEGQNLDSDEEDFGAKRFEPIRTLMSKGEAVLVSVNYRLGVFGFLAVDSDEQNTTSARINGNYGLMDQILALQWIKENIEDFHGDPNLVIVYGESSGTETLSGLLKSPKSKNLFQGMFAVDPAWLPIKTLDDVKDLNNIALSKTTCQKDVECLRKLDTSQIIESFSVSEPEKQSSLHAELKQYLYPYHHNLALTIDENTLFFDEKEEMSNYQQPNVPVFIGQVCHHLCITGKDKLNSNAKHIGQLFNMEPKTMQRAMKLYNAQGDRIKAKADIVSEMAFDIKMCQTEKFLRSANFPNYYLVSLPRNSLVHGCGSNSNNNRKHSSSFLCSDNLHKELSTKTSKVTNAKADLRLLWNDIFLQITEQHPSGPLGHKDGDHVVSVAPDSVNSVCHFWDHHKPFQF